MIVAQVIEILAEKNLGLLSSDDDSDGDDCSLSSDGIDSNDLGYSIPRFSNYIESIHSYANDRVKLTNIEMNKIVLQKLGTRNHKISKNVRRKTESG